ncbi:NAD-dependent protein deacetylase sirtuin-3, mitochondrial isoform X3 [Nycticebus coucang]|uniref:NAD-dependent protein deacetylase sirtuin-3, mitochondrial isoform X3 n=1 Tax=Nycticebus coucang TaxID=9470 RepID=UPI00234DF6E1|nr:NAD-dependent protein deacetylase sirtuin-3, mitochondrial isoform X3 [Nycticebus coucang]
MALRGWRSVAALGLWGPRGTGVGAHGLPKVPAGLAGSGLWRRSPGSGLYSNLQQYNIPYPEAIFELTFFFHNPKPFFTLAKELYPGNFRPNVTHYFLRLLHDKGLLLRLYTQNIDGLERVSGIPASKLVEAHGTFASATCTVCQSPFPGDNFWADVLADRVPRCPACTGVVKPDIVFFGEPLPQRFLLHVVDFPMADLLLILGTSLEVCQLACGGGGWRTGRGGGAFCQLVRGCAELSAPSAHQPGFGGTLGLASSQQGCGPARGCGSQRGKAGGASRLDGRDARPCRAGNQEAQWTRQIGG